MTKPTYKTLASAILICLSSLMVSCSKKAVDAGPDPGPVSTRIRAISDSTVSSYGSERVDYIFSYNADSTLNHVLWHDTRFTPPVQQDSDVIMYTYIPTRIQRTFQRKGTNMVLEVDASGKVTFVGLQAVTYYAGTNKVRTIGSSTLTYYWDADNISYFVYSGDTAVYEYYTDRVATPADGLKVTELESYGTFITHTKNLIKKITSKHYPEINTAFDYTFDSNGRITNLTVSRTNSREYYTYYY
jgi:hypothetical protein